MRAGALVARILPADSAANGLLVTFLVALAWFGVAKSAYLWVASQRPELVGFVALAAAAPAAFAWRETYAGASPAFAMLLRGIALILGFYALAAYHVFPPDLAGSASTLVHALHALQALAVAAAVAALWRPAFALVPAFYVLIAKDWTQYLLSVPTLTRTDYLPVVELGAFMAIGFASSVLVSRLPRLGVRGPDRHKLTLLLFYAAVAIHFGNYFYSAVQKLVLDGGWLSWVLENPTQLLLSNTIVTGHLPIAQFGEASVASFEWFGRFVVPVNAAVLLVQLYSVVAIAFRRQLIATTIAYDLSHVVIFAACGILFWKWILLNIVIVAAARKYVDSEFTPRERWLGPLFVVMGTLVFFAARLGWYDTPAFNHAYFLAGTTDGRTYRVPSNYFAAASVTVAQMRLGSIGDEKLPTGTWGATSRSALLPGAAGCDYERTLEPVERPADIAALGRFVRAHHRAVLSRVDGRGRFDYDLYPHHIWSNVALFDGFEALDKRTIGKYTYVNEAVCVTLENGALRQNVYRRYEVDIRVD
jgi:hypothetical protein